MIPCKIDKCIKYPSCIAREYIICTLLDNYYQKTVGHHEHVDVDDFIMTWELINKEFPKLTWLASEDELTAKEWIKGMN